MDAEVTQGVGFDQTQQFFQYPINPFCMGKVVRTEPGTVIKYIGDFVEGVLCTNFARELQLPVPRLLHYPGDPSHPAAWKMPRPGDPQIETGVWYICTEGDSWRFAGQSH